MKSHERLYLLDRLIREKKFPNRDDINAILESTGADEISDRQFLRDIRDLKDKIQERYPRETNDLLTFNRLKNGYQYKEGYSAFADFSKQEIKSLADVMDQLKNFKHLFMGSESLGIYEKIKALSIEQEYEKGNDLIHWSPVALIKEGERKGQENFDALIKHIQDRECIKINYRKLDGTYKEHHCLPVLIKEYNSGWYTGWYLLALPIKADQSFYLANLNDLIVYALDRIEGIKKSDLEPKIKINKSFNPHEYFDHVFGIIRNNLGQNNSPKVEKVQIETTDENWIFDYILKYPIHHSQHIIKKDDKNKYLKFSIDIEVDTELENYLFKHSAELRVIKPINLRDRIIERLNRSLEGY